MKKQFLSLAGALALTIALTSCGDTDKPVETTENAPSDMGMTDALPGDSARMARPEGVMVDGVAMTADKNIVENAMNASSVSTLVAAVQQAGLVETLSGPGPFTVFAPTNAAFDKLPKGAVEGLMKPESKEKLASVLTYHVIPGRLVAADLRDGQELTTVNGEKLKIMMQDGKVMIGNGDGKNATVQIADVISSNGVTHVIDAVVLPTK